MKTGVVLGINGALGRAIAEMLLEEGYERIIGSHRSKKNLEDSFFKDKRLQLVFLGNGR